MKSLSVCLLLACLLPPFVAGAAPPGQTEKLSNAEWRADDGRISAYGYISDFWTKDGQWYLSIDYVEWLSEAECRRRVKAGTLDWDEGECEVDVRIVNNDEELKRFDLAEGVEVIIKHPSRPVSTLSPSLLADVWHAPTGKTAELREGLWQIFRRANVIERIEWVYTP